MAVVKAMAVLAVIFPFADNGKYRSQLLKEAPGETCEVVPFFKIGICRSQTNNPSFSPSP
jgi:hypothetical protein